MDYIRKLPILSNQGGLGQFIRCAIVGGVASLVDITVFSISTNTIGINYLLSNTFSFLCGLTVNYLLSREWVFNRKVHNTGRDFMLFSIIGLIGLVMSSILLYAMIDLKFLYYLLPFHNDSLVKSAAKLTAVIIVFFWNFFARKRIVFST